MSLLRWMPTFLAFPLSGLTAMFVFGSVSTPLAALGAGLLAGAVIGGAQWLALGRAADWRWMVGSAVAVSAGMTIAVLAAGPPVVPHAAIAAGLMTGALLGAVQGMTLGRGITVAMIWTAIVALAWALGWLITSFVIVDIGRGHVVFGASGAIVTTLLTGIALRRILGPRRRRTATAAVEADAGGSL